MIIQFHTDANITSTPKLQEEVNDVVASTLAHVSDRISRVEVHLTDENGKKAGVDDIRCMMEVRVEGRPPTAVTHHASSVHEAIGGAAERLLHSLEHALGRVNDRKGNESIKQK
ncbi:MAG: ribosomal subunit interface protein [Myxococcus sp.]|nr:ribosomal subunit interface protein [Myxococcus sp.]